jgi:hypothetical protein
MTVTSISDLPTPPSRSDSPSTFSTRANALMAALGDMVDEHNDQAAELDALAISAAAAAAAGLAGTSAVTWVTGTTYTRGQKVWSPIDYKTYRRKANGAGATDPSADSTNWALIAGTGNVKLTATQTLTNKTLTDPALDGTILEDVYTITDAAGFEIDPSNGSVQKVTLGASRTPLATNFANGEQVELRIADGTAYSITWSSINPYWIDDLTAVLPTSGYAVVILWKVDDQMYAAYAGDVS